MLNENQLEIYKDLINSEKGSKHVICGAAGTGKTYLISHLIRHYIDNDISIIVLAPTHQALKVLEEKIGINGLNLSTVASALCQYGIRYEGEVVFKRPGVSKKLKTVETIIIDESSMLSLDQENIFLSLPQRVIFVGDGGQLRAVLKKNTTLFSKDFDNIKVHKLLIQMRNAGPIEVLASKSRDKVIFPTNSCNHIKVYNDSCSHEEEFLKALSKSADPLNLIYIAFTNDRVNQISKKIDIEKYPYLRLETNLKWLGCRGDSVKITKIISRNNELHGVKYDLLEVESPIDKKLYTIKSISTLESKKLEERVKSMLKQKESLIAAFANSLLEMFITTSSPFVITTHKSQGITREKVFVDTNDINRSRGMRKRLLYVAYSRASKELHTIKM